MAERPLRLFLVAGEESGDQLGAGLIDAIRRRRPDATFSGLAGERMKALGMTSVFPLGEVAIMGIGSLIRHLPRIVRRVHELVATAIAAQPDALVIIDSPEFTHAVARRVARHRPDLPIIDYVSPTVWAWRSYRARRMRAYVDHVLALLPFEPAVHARLGGPPCSYVGHPLIERLDLLEAVPGERKPIAERPVLLILPGSRQSEISRLMSPFGEAVGLIVEQEPEVEILLPAVPHLADAIRTGVASWPRRPEIILGEMEKFAAFRRAHAALAASGTVTLELALAGVPMVVAYRLDPLAKFLKPLVKVPSIVLANLVLGENVVPEFLDGQASPDALARAVLTLLSDGDERKAQLAAFERLRTQVALPDGVRPSDAAAAIVIDAAESGTGRRAAMLQRRAETGT